MGGVNRDARTVLMFLTQERAEEVLRAAGGTPVPGRPFDPGSRPAGLKAKDLIPHLTDDELWHLAMSWCRGRKDPPLPRDRAGLLELLDRVCG